jgi:hypothetical protein
MKILPGQERPLVADVQRNMQSNFAMRLKRESNADASARAFG